MKTERLGDKFFTYDLHSFWLVNRWKGKDERGRKENYQGQDLCYLLGGKRMSKLLYKLPNLCSASMSEAHFQVPFMYFLSCISCSSFVQQLEEDIG